MQPSQPATSPFRQKIFSLMNQQPPNKVIKISQKIHNKTINTTLSPFKEYSLESDLAQIHKLSRLDSSSGVLHFKSLQQKLGLKNASNQKSRGKHSSFKSSDNYNQKNRQQQKKVSFKQKQSKFYYKSSKSKSKSKTKHSIKQMLSKSTSSYKTHNLLSPKQKSILKASSSKSIQKIKQSSKMSQTMTQNHSRKPFDSTQQYVESSDKETQKKNYLLQTLKKMESVRKNLTRTFRQFDQEHNSKTERIGDEIYGNKSKEKSKSNLTVISDFVNEESQSATSYAMRKKSSKAKNSKSKHRPKDSSEKIVKQRNQQSDIFHKKKPSKNSYIMSQQSFQQQDKHSNQKSKPGLQKHLLKQMISSCKNPQKWQTLLSNELISVLFRIVKRKLIEIEIHAENAINTLDIELEKCHFACQSLKQHYENVRKKEIITLLCSVRGIDIACEGLNLLELPKLMLKIEAKLEENNITFRKEVTLPYTWIMLVEKEKKQKQKLASSKKHSNSINNRVKTRSILQNLDLTKNLKQPNILQIFSFCEVPQKKQKSIKKQKKHLQNSSTKLLSTPSAHKISERSQRLKFIYAFQIEEQQFKLIVSLNQNLSKSNKNTFDIEIEGKGQDLLEKILLFMELLS